MNIRTRLIRMNGAFRPEISVVSGEDTTPPEQRRHQRPSQLRYAEHDNPDEVRDHRGRPTARKAQSLSGEGKFPEAKAGSRKARENHNPPDRSHDQPERVLTGNRFVTRQNEAKELNLRTS